ncbi:YobI family P-loop NTPase [Oerskovia sp. USHLN155]|uniref:YobI family P-loop NTPase n=1 Tax=Oerskovia sp. USHLN155 TaxID=3081288 RepID=UPI003019A2BE
MAALPLQSLAPRFDEEQHETYLRRLEEAIRDPRNLNIALTGRYGAGKSSVLDMFEANHRRTTQRLAISTLAPGEEGESTTNRIQKEVVKQLVYGASQKVGKNSRFAKIAVLSKPRAFAQAAVLVLGVGALLYLFGWLPDIKWTGPDESAWARWAAWAGAAALATGVVGSLRLVTYGRFLSDVSAAGAGLTLSEKAESFFDKYLDEIVHYFDQESRDIVIFEDLDRFEDPHIFEALRELNVLLNETPKRRRKRRGSLPGRTVTAILEFFSTGLSERVAARLSYRWATRLLGRGVPLRFVYAVRDSVFGKIDAATAGTATREAASRKSAAPTSGAASESDAQSAASPPETPSPAIARPMDAAATETLRANRTKFFDIVIPLVPFISHRNARDLLIRLLVERGIEGVEPRLVNTIARHCTDMRLMRNMCNEYLVFAERLLDSKAPKTPAPGVNPSRLFALVAYKNFHLEDFENITRRDSDLDRLYEIYRRMVRENIATRDDRKRILLAEPERVRTRTETASMLGARLITLAGPMRSAAGYSRGSISFRVGTRSFESGDAAKYEFWAEVAQRRTLKVLVAENVVGELDSNSLVVFAPEGLDASRWDEYDESSVQSELASIEADIERLRRADFADLNDMTQFMLIPKSPESVDYPNPPGPADSPKPSDSPAPTAGAPSALLKTFAQLLEATLQSDLACDLVRRRYIDRNFTLYAAQFYGHFIGVEVANFMVQHVQTNTMDVAYDLGKAGYVANLLTEANDAGEELLDAVSAYNIDIVNYLLINDHAGAAVVVKHLVASGPDNDARIFLAAYFTSSKSERTRLAALLAGHGWREVFNYLAGDDDVPMNARPTLISVAIAAFDSRAIYDFDEDARMFIAAHYGAMPAFGPMAEDEEFKETTDDAALAVGNASVPGRVVAVLERAQVVISDLAKVSDLRVRALIVDARRYTLTADNLRTALGHPGMISLDRAQDNGTVYAHCLEQISAYLAAVGSDSATDYAVKSPEVLVTVLRDLTADWDEVQMADPLEGGIAELLAHTSPDACLTELRLAPRSTWSAVAAAGLFRASLANVEEYRAHADGAVDPYLASLLKRAGNLHVDTAAEVTGPDGNEYDRVAAAVAILNAQAGLTNEECLQLAESLNAPLPLSADDITWDKGDLFALLIERELIDDNAPTFDRIRIGGWAALGPAIAASGSIAKFITPALVEGMVGALLTDRSATAKVGHLVVEDIDQYVPDDDWPALKAAATYADTHAVSFTPATVARIARVQAHSDGTGVTLMLRLLCATTPGPTVDDIVEVFTHLGAPYNLISQSGAKFKLDREDVHDRLLRVLRTSGRITRGTSHETAQSRSQYTVTVN